MSSHVSDPYNPETLRTIQRTATFKVRRKSINKEERTVEVAFSSEEPIEDFPGFFHILEHSASAANLDRLNDGAPVLVNHDPKDHVGVVDKAWIGNDRKGRGVLRFGESERAEEIFKDVVTGIRRHISLGADITGEIVLENEKDGQRTYRIKGWRGTEISFASIPADSSVGVGRAHKQPKRRQSMSDESTAALKVEREKAATSTAERINEIYAIGEEFGVGDLAREYATNGKLSDDDLIALKKKAGDTYLERKQKEIEDLEAGKSTPITALGLSPNDTKRFSVTRALSAILEGGNWKGAEFELECSNEIARMLDREPRGVFIPAEIQERQYTVRGQKVTREMTTTGAATGAEYVGVQHSPENFIEQLRNAVVAIRAGARLLPGLRQTLDIPLKNAGATFAWLAESGTVTLSNLGTGNLTLVPKTVGGGVQASRRMVKQSIPAIDDLIMQDLAEGAAEIIDLGIVEGSGASNQPTGIINTTGVNTQIVNPNDAPTYAEVVGFRSALATDNALKGALAWVLTSAWVGNVMTTVLDAGSGRFIMDPLAAGIQGNPNIQIGYPVHESNALTTGTAVLGNWSEVLVGMWGVLDLRPDPYTAADADAIIIRAFQDIDVGVRHAVSFCKNVLT